MNITFKEVVKTFLIGLLIATLGLGPLALLIAYFKECGLTVVFVLLISMLLGTLYRLVTSK